MCGLYRGQEVEGAAGLQIFGDLKAEGDGGDAGGSLRGDTGDLFAIGREHLRVHAPGEGGTLVAQRSAMDADGDLAAAAEGLEHGALGLDGETRFRMIERGDGASHGLVALRFRKDSVMGGTSLESQSALAGRGAEFVDGEALVDPLGAAEAIEAGGSEDESVALTSGELAQTGVDVAANFDEGDVRTEGEQFALRRGLVVPMRPPQAARAAPSSARRPRRRERQRAAEWRPA